MTISEAEANQMAGAGHNLIRDARFHLGLKCSCVHDENTRRGFFEHLRQLAGF
jgi:hypothetical protein